MGIAGIHASRDIHTFQNVGTFLKTGLKGASIQNMRLDITSREEFRSCLPTLVANVADFGDRSAPEPVRAMSAWLINQGAQQLGVKLNSPDSFYRAMALGKFDRQLAVPAINIRGNSLDTARAVFSAANELGVGAFISEIARSEIGYTNQQGREYAAVNQAAAMLEGWTGPLFLQGDHIQLSAEKVGKGGADEEKEQAAHSALIRSLLTYGFGSIDLDMSPFEKRNNAELSFDEQQRVNYDLTARKIWEIRDLERELELPYTVMLGGETGEVGKMNTRREDIEAYANGLVRALDEIRNETGLTLESIRKIAVQTGTSHGGITLPDGSKAEVKIDFGVLAMAREASKRFGWAGPVQHGASTLPDAAFSNFVTSGAAEVHLATGFQDIIFDTGIVKVPGLQSMIEKFLVSKLIGEWKDGQTFAQFAKGSRKKANGPFKFEMWTMPEEVRQLVSNVLRAKFAFLFGALCVTDTRDLVSQHVSDINFTLPYPAKETAEVQQTTDDGGKDLAD